MKILVTAGHTIVPIDKVRSITNIFKGRTGTEIAKYLAINKQETILLTSNPELLNNQSPDSSDNLKGYLKIMTYHTYADLEKNMRDLITNNEFDVVIHSAAVSDYYVDDVYMVDSGGQLIVLDKNGKISSSIEPLYLKMIKTKKIVDLIKSEWGFAGYLVKFKLEVGLTDDNLIEIASRSLAASNADLIVANCLEWYDQIAYLLNKDNQLMQVKRKYLPEAIYQRIKEDLK